MTYRFEEYELDLQRYELRYASRLVKIEPQVFNLLAYLIGHRDRLITKEELLEQLWAGRVVVEATLTSCIRAARKAVGDDGRVQRLIQTLHGRGYRFIAPIEEPLGDTADVSELDDGHIGARPLPRHPPQGRVEHRTEMALEPSTDETLSMPYGGQYVRSQASGGAGAGISPAALPIAASAGGNAAGGVRDWRGRPWEDHSGGDLSGRHPCLWEAVGQPGPMFGAVWPRRGVYASTRSGRASVSSAQ